MIFAFLPYLAQWASAIGKFLTEDIDQPSSSIAPAGFVARNSGTAASQRSSEGKQGELAHL
jgi:hypothetical protein